LAKTRHTTPDTHYYACALPEQLLFDVPSVDKGVVSSRDGGRRDEVVKLFKKALMQHRYWEREKNKEKISA
jgi:hypothetical protein